MLYFVNRHNMRWDVTAGATGATVVAQKFSDILTLFQPGPGWQILPHHCRGRTNNILVVTSLNCGTE